MAFRLQQLRSKAVVAAHSAAKQLIGNGQHSVVNPPLMESPKQLFFSRIARNNSNGLGFSRGIHFSAPLLKRESNSSDIFSYMGGLSGEQTQLIKKLVNFRMIGGKKTKVRGIVYQTLQRAARNDSDVVRLVTSAIENIKPICEVQKVGSRGFSHSVPWVVPRERQLTLAIRWIYDAAEKRRTSKIIGLDKCLFSEVLDAHQKKGAARKKRETVHGIASANRSFAHYRWW